MGSSQQPVRQVWVLRSLPLWLMREYLVELGGRVLEGGEVAGEGWIARLEQVEDFQLGSIIVGQVRLTLQAEQEAWQQLQPVLEMKLLRAGG